MTEPSQDRIGAYRIIRRLGMGGMGEVFLAWDARLERSVALKRLRPDRAMTGARRERFRREARAAARLSHSNIVQIFDLVEAEEGAATGDAIVMEYVQGRSLADLLSGGPAAPGVAIEIARQVAEGLAAAHAQGLVHRDLKAENVMVTPAGQVKILDFGLARPLASGTGETLTDDGVVLGTFRAMSPEQARGESAGVPSDLFSLGVLLYEMLAGRTPFLGETPLETLRKVTTEAPPPLDAVPPELARLVHSLLEKDPARRPPDAGKVAMELRALASRLELAAAPDWAGPLAHPESDSLGEAATLIEGSAGIRTPGADSSRFGRRRKAIAALAVLATLVAILSLWAGWTRVSRAPLRVAVLKPAANGQGEAMDLTASGVLVGTLRTLLSLEGVTPIDPSLIGEVQGGASQIARAVSADEVLTATVTGGGATALVSFQRVKADGGVLWAESLQVPTDSKDALVLANGIAAALRRGYSDHGIRPGYPDLSVGAADYAEFLRIKQRIDAGRTSWEPELERLESLADRSPGFLDAHLLATVLASNLYDDSKNPAYLERADASLRRARLLAPDLPPVLATEIRLAIKRGDWARAEQVLGALERVAPGDTLVLIQRALLASHRGKTAEAISFMREVVERQPTWRDLLWLGDLESRSGDVASARRHLEAALDRTPGNARVLAKLGELELLHGDLRRAERIYGDLIRSGPHRSDLTNRGLVRYLLGRYAEAAADYRSALALEPGHLTVTLNLADAELALGHKEVAANLYRQALAALEEKARKAVLEPTERTIQAQCLAHLGEDRRAVEIVLSAIQESPENAEVAYQSALVLSLAGERASAMALARKALSLGVQPRWFAIPGFDGLRSDPAFGELLPPIEPSAS